MTQEPRMPAWNVSSESTWVPVETDSWLYALARALPKFRLTPGALDQVVCSMNKDGSVDVVDLVTGAQIRVARQESGPPTIYDMPRSSLAGTTLDDIVEGNAPSP